MIAFVSQPMKGKTKAEIMAVRKKAQRILNEYFGKVEILDSYFENLPEAENHAHESVFYLAKSLELMSNADVVYFAPGWNTARGCIVENMVANTCGIPTVVDDA